MADPEYAGLMRPHVLNFRGKDYDLVLLALVISFAIGLIVTAYFTIALEYVPSNYTITPSNGTDMDVLVVRNNDIRVPVRDYFVHQPGTITAQLYFKHTPLFIKDIKLSANSSQILTVKSDRLDLKSGGGSGIYTANVEIGHPLEVKTFSETYSVDIYYRRDVDAGQVLRQSIPFTWTVETLDFGKPSYFWIIFLGVVASRVFSLSGSGQNPWSFLQGKDLLWVPFSAIITLLIFSSFRDQVHLTADLMTNLALAFGFGFGFDKVFETWTKTTTRTPAATSIRE